MGSREDAIEAGAASIRGHARNQAVNLTTAALDAMLASGAVHLVDECPTAQDRHDLADALVTGSAQLIAWARRAEKAEQENAVLRVTHEGTPYRNAQAYMQAVSDQMAAERQAAAYRVALERIAAWDTKGGKLLGYEGPRAVARAALASPIEEKK